MNNINNIKTKINIYKETAVSLFKKFGFNVLPLAGKRPLIKWEEWQNEKQSIEDIEQMPWENASGTGVVMKDELLNIDIDKVKDRKIVNEILDLLKLPQDYKWVVQSGSGMGYHIYLLLRDKEKIYERLGKTSAVFKFRMKDEEVCDHIELRLRECQNAVPPSQHISGGVYSFIIDEPDKEPEYVDEEVLLNCLENICRIEAGKEEPEKKEINQAESYYDKERLESALSYLSAHLPESCYEEWYRVGFALVPIGEEGEKYFIKFSLENKNYTDSEYSSREKFRELQKKYDGRITLGTVYGLAEKYGWQKPLMKFWSKDEKNNVRISRARYKRFLESEGFCKYKLDSNFLLVRVKNNIVEEVSTVMIKDFVMGYIAGIPAESLESISRSEIVEALLKGANNLFNAQFMEFLITKKLEFNKDTESIGFFYYKNGFAEINANGVTFNEYSKLNKCIWEKHILKRNYRETKRRSDYEDFVYNVCNKETERYNSLRSAIGYLLHSYKSPAVLKAIIFLDEKLSDGAYGQSGKGLICKSIGHVRNMVSIDGKNFNINSDFAFQRVSPDTTVIAIEDLKEKFPFERLFSIITDGLTVEKKNQDQIYLPVTESPKLVITNNYIISGTDDSTMNRQFVIEFSDYYNKNHIPLDDFGKFFFEGWDEDDWAAFDNYMIECLQLYLKNGLMSYSYVNLTQKQLIDETCPEFVEFAEELQLDTVYDKKELYESFKTEYSDYEKLQQQKFTKWLKVYGRIKNLRVEESKSGTKRMIIFAPLKQVA